MIPTMPYRTPGDPARNVRRMDDDTQATRLTSAATPETHIAEALQYHCPGERQPISRAVHLTRLAQGFAACQDCEHRNDVGPVTVPLRHTTSDLSSIWQAEGIRGLHYESITPQRLGAIAAAVAEVIARDQLPRAIPSPEVAQRRYRAAVPPSQRTLGPKLVVGYDTRLSSRGLFVAVVEALSRWGCTVIDVGCVSRACFDFSVVSLQATGGLYITGGTEPQRCNGLDIIGSLAEPWSWPGRLQEIADQFAAPRARPLRRAVPASSFDPVAAYRAAIQPHFHALRPLRVGVLCDCPLTARTLEELFERLPCTLELIPPPTESGTRSHETRAAQLSRLVQSRHLDVGVMIEADGRCCHLFDECGEPVAGDAVLLALAEMETLESETVRLVSPPQSGHRRLPRRVERLTSPEALPRHQQLVAQLMQQDAQIAYDGQGRYWFRGSIPACDAVVTIGRVLQRLSLEDRRVSDTIDSIGERDLGQTSR